VIGLTQSQQEILALIDGEQGNSAEARWWSAMEVVRALGHGTGPGIGCAMKGLYKRGLLRRLGAMTIAGRRQTVYQITAEGLRVLELERKAST